MPNPHNQGDYEDKAREAATPQTPKQKITNMKTKLKTTADGQVLTPDKIKSLRESYRMICTNLHPDITDSGQAFLFGVVHAFNKCGCRITGNGTLNFPLTIEYCKLHKAAPKLKTACQRALDSFCGKRPADTAPASQAEYDIIAAAISKANP